MFYLAVVLEEGQVIDGSFDAQDEAELVVEFSETGPMVCLIRVPSMRTLKRLPISPSNCRDSFLPRKVAMLSGLTVWMAVRLRFS